MPGPAPSVYSPEEMRMPVANSQTLEAALNVAQRIGDGLAVLAREQGRKLFLVAVEQRHEAQEDAGAHLRIAGGPLRLGSGSISDGGRDPSREARAMRA